VNFGAALERLKEGGCVSRAGWNGKGMYIYLNHGSVPAGMVPSGEPAPQFVSGVALALFGVGDHGTVIRLPNINMCAADDGATVTGWLASQADMLAEDWDTA
jgi:hypothetical protein